MIEFGIKDAIDILIVAMLLYYLFKLMKESGAIKIFSGLIAFVVVWVVTGWVHQIVRKSNGISKK